MGWENVFHCEWEDFPRKILNHYWPNAQSYGDIKQTDFTIHRGQIDILTGGFPCQPYSQAGKRLGKEDVRHLWPEMLRAIREIAPAWVVGENVRGFINWNGGLVFDEVQADLEAAGYEVQPFLLPACGVNAPHRRDRIWFVAKNSKRNGCLRGKTNKEGAEVWEQRDVISGNTDGVCKQKVGRPTANARHAEPQGREQSAPNKERCNGKGIQERNKSSSLGGNVTNTTGFRGREREGREKPFIDWEFNTQKRWETFPTKPPICGGDDGLSRELDGITFSKWRKESIKSYGNAIVPQVAYQIFRAIAQYESEQLKQ